MEKKNTKKQKMTIDGLAVLMKQGFGRIDKKIIGLDGKIVSLDEKMDANHESMAKMVNTAVQATQDLLVEKIDSLGKKFEGEFKTVKYQLDKIEVKLDGQEKTIFNHDQRLDTLEVDFKLKKA